MRRRGFLGFLGGAAVAGPGMAKAAASKVAEDLALGVGGSAFSNQFPMPPSSLGYATPSSGVGTIEQIVRGKDMLQKLVGMTPSARAKLKRRVYVGALDPDLASYKSMSIGFRVDLQRERNLEFQIGERRTMWRRIADGLDGHDDEPM